MLFEVGCDQGNTFVDQDPPYPEVRVFMTEKEALFYEWDCGVSQQESSSKGNLWSNVPSARALSQDDAGPSGHHVDEVDSDDIEVVYSKEALANTKTEVLEVESDVESHPGEGMLLKNPRSSVKTEDIKL